jgi:hypothetical protein
MGYYVRIVESTAVIPAENLNRAYEKMCDLNVTHDHIKRGGSWSGGKQTAKWFSWMDANYPETCKDAKEVLEELGFNTEYNQKGDLLITEYDSKTGQEELFLEAISNEAFGEIRWVGEDGYQYSTVFAGSSIIEGEYREVISLPYLKEE